MTRQAALIAFALAAIGASAAPARAEHLYDFSYKTGCLGLCNDKISYDSFEDPLVPGVVCHLSRAVNGSFNPLAEDYSDTSLACRQFAPIEVDLKKLKEQDGQNVFTQSTSIFFKAIRVIRVVDVKHNTILYGTASTKLFDGSPKNAISSVPVMPWGR